MLKTIITSIVLLFTTNTFAWLDICNYSTENNISVAIAYAEGNTWVSEGWWNIDQGQCKTVIGGTLKNVYYYYYAYGSHGGEWSGNYSFCTINNEFTLYNAGNACSNGQWQNFREINTKDYDDFTQKLTD